MHDRIGDHTTATRDKTDDVGAPQPTAAPEPPRRRWRLLPVVLPRRDGALPQSRSTTW